MEALTDDDIKQIIELSKNENIGELVILNLLFLKFIF